MPGVFDRDNDNEQNLQREKGFWPSLKPFLMPTAMKRNTKCLSFPGKETTAEGSKSLHMACRKYYP
jgi:hypothetical protein